jgi:hypothetical protein
LGCTAIDALGSHAGSSAGIFALDFSHHLPGDLAEALPKVVQPWIARMAEELSLAIGGLGIAASDPNVLYAATGEWTSGIGFPTDPVVTGVVGREFDVHPNQYRRGRISSSKTSSGSKPGEIILYRARSSNCGLAH